MRSYLLLVDDATWDAFRARLKAESLKVKDVIPALIAYYVAHGLPKIRKK